MDIVILAGGKCDLLTQEKTGVVHRADLPFLGKKMVEIVLEAVQDFGEPIIVGGSVGPAARQVPAGESFIASLANGLSAVTSEKLLLVTADLPCLTPQAIRTYLDNCDFGAALNYPIIRTEICEQMFPGMKRTSLKLKEGEFTGGNIALMDTNMIKSALPIMEKAYAYRKSPLKLASLLGFGTVCKVALSKLVPGTLKLQRLEQIMTNFLQVPVRAIETPAAEIGADIDNYSQYEALLARFMLEK